MSGKALATNPGSNRAIWRDFLVLIRAALAKPCAFDQAGMFTRFSIRNTAWSGCTVEPQWLQ